MYNNTTFTIDQAGKETFTYSENEDFLTVCSPYLPKIDAKLKSVRAEKVRFFTDNLEYKIIRLYTYKKPTI